MSEESCTMTPDDRYTLTPWQCLYGVLNDYGISVSNITATIGEHLVNDFMNEMVKCGHIMTMPRENSDGNEIR